MCIIDIFRVINTSMFVSGYSSPSKCNLVDHEYDVNGLPVQPGNYRKILYY